MTNTKLINKMMTESKYGFMSEVILVQALENGLQQWVDNREAIVSDYNKRKEAIEKDPNTISCEPDAGYLCDVAQDLLDQLKAIY